MIRFVRAFKQRIKADIYKSVETPEHKFTVSAFAPKTDKTGAIFRQFILRIDGRNKVRSLFYSSTAYLEAKLDGWILSPEDKSCIFLPRFGDYVLLVSKGLKKIQLPEYAMKGEFVSNLFFENYLLIHFTKSVMLTNIYSYVSAVYEFSFQIKKVEMIDPNILLLIKQDGEKVKYDRQTLSFID